MSNNILLLSSHLYKPNSNIPHAGTLSPGNLLAVTRVEKRAEAGGAVWVETIVGVSVLALENASRHSRLHSLSPYP